MDERVVALIEALNRAAACRTASSVGAICHRCWEDVDRALAPVIAATKNEADIAAKFHE